MSELLFDTPWWLPALVATVGVVLFVTGNKRVEARVRLAGVIVVALAIGLVALSYVVDTPLETAVKRTHELVDAFERADFAAMTPILDPDAAVTVLNAPVYTSRDEIIAAAKKAHDRYGFKNAMVLNTTAEQAQTTITITIVLLTEQTSFTSTLNSEWQFEWQQLADGWALVEVRALKIGQSTGDQAQRLFPGK